MKVDIYNSARNREKFLTVPAGTELNTTEFSGMTDDDYASVVAFRKGENIERTDTRIGMNVDDIIDQLEARGYATHGAKITVTEGTAKPSAG